ncbi:MAG TPA: PorV/PorQ family protein [bacterium]
MKTISSKFEVFSFKLWKIFNFEFQIENFTNLNLRTQNSKLAAPGFIAAIVLILGFLIQGAAQAQQTTSGADFLRIDSGARSQGMGSAFTAVADDVTALTWNPAGIALLEHPEAGYLRMLYLSDIAYNFGGIAIPLPLGENTLGLGIGVINLGTTFDSTLGIAPAVSVGDNSFSLSLAYRIKNLVSFGITGKYILQNIAGYNSGAFGGDFGVLVTPGDRFRIGAGIFNLGQTVQFISSGDPLPLTGRLGLAYTVLQVPHHSILLSVDNTYLFQTQSYQYAGGFEYWYDKALAVRAGYTGDATQGHWTVGAGINLKVAQLDYAYAPIGTLGDTHRLSLVFRFGAEEIQGLLTPSGFTVTAFDSGAALSWKAADSPDLVGYNLYVKRPGESTFARINGRPMKDTLIRIKKLRNGSTYSFAVASVSGAGRESSMAELSTMPGASQVVAPPVLSAPTGFKALAEGAGLQLIWDKAPSSDVAGFNLYLADDQGKPGKKISATLITDNQAGIKKVNPDKAYRFVLTCVTNAGVESEPTDVLEAKLSDLQKATLSTLLPPDRFSAETSDGAAHLFWSSVKGVIGYNLYTSDDGKSFRRLTKSGPKNIVKVVLRPLKNGRTYYFGITSVMPDGKESEKKIQSVTLANTSSK